MSDPRLDRVVQFDEKSCDFPIRTLLPQLAPRSYTWRGYSVLDQGQEGACVGFGWAHELMARPVVVQGVTAATARQIYQHAKEQDERDGENYSGTSVLAGAKAVSDMTRLLEYRWGFGIDDLVQTLGYYGPVVLGLNWYSGMMATTEAGQIAPTGRIQGGHCVLADSVSTRLRRISGPNSWGQEWGLGGRWWMTWDDMDRLLREDGEQCIPVRRQ